MKPLLALVFAVALLCGPGLAQNSAPDGLTIQATLIADTMIRSSGRTLTPSERLALIQQLRGQLTQQVSSDSGLTARGEARPALVRRIDQAKGIIRLATPAVRDVEIARALLRAAARGVKVYILVDQRENNPQTSYNTLLATKPNILVRALPTRGDSILNLDSQLVVNAALVADQRAAQQPTQVIDNPTVGRVNAAQFDQLWTQTRPLTR